MNKIKELIAKLLGQEFATADEKAELKSLFEDLGASEKEAVQSDYDNILKFVETEEEVETAKQVEAAIGALVAKKSADAVDAMKKEIKDFIAQHKDLREKKAGIYAPGVQENRKELNQYTHGLMKALVTGVETEEFAARKEMSTDDAASPYAGYTVDSELAAEIRHIMTEYGTAIREFNSVQLSKNSYKANELVTDAVVYWVDEAGSISSSQVVLGQNTLELKKIATIVAWTNELLEDTEIDFISFVGGRVAELFAEKEDEAFFNGDGTSTYGGFTGLLNSSNVNAVTMTGTTFATITPDDLLSMIDNTPSGALKNAKFYMHRTIWSLIRKHKDSQNAYIFQEPSATGPATAWGFPVVHVEVMPTSGDTAANTPFVIFGDLKKGTIRGFKGGMTVTKSDSATIRNVADSADINLFTSDRIGIRWTQRVGYIQTINNLKIPITVLSTAAASA